MNTMDMLFKQTAMSTPKQSVHTTNQSSKRNALQFKQTLQQTGSQELSNNDHPLPKSMMLNNSERNIRSTIQQLSQESKDNSTMSRLPVTETNVSMSQLLEHLQSGQDLASFSMQTEEMGELTLEDLQAMLLKLSEASEEVKALLEELDLELDTDMDLETLTTDELAQLSVLAQLQPLLEQVAPLLKKLDDGNLASKDWLKLLNQFETLPNDVKQTLSSKLLTEENQNLLKEMMTKFQSRMALSEKGYVTHSKVTTDDISKWLSQALERQSGKSQPTFGEAFATSKGSQPLEQLTIHLSQSASSNQQTLNQELVEQFEAVLQKMQVGKNLLGQQQIKLQLNPNNLGQITVEMMEIDGEMFVKLIASSDMAKEALEANMKELRHMFSPHQVIVEQEEQASVVNASELLDYQEQDEQTDNQDEQVNYSEDDEETELSFSDILSQEGV